MTNTMPQPPKVPKKPQRFEKHGDVRVDDYFWLREKTNPEVIEILKAENAYTESILKPVEKLRTALFEEMKGRIKEDDAEVPYKWNDYYYYTRVEAGKQYGIFCRKHKSLEAKEEILLDGNALAEGQKYFKIGIFEVSPNQKLLAYAVDLDGSEKFTIHFKDLTTGKQYDETIKGAYTSLEWANDNKTVFYTILDEHERPDRVLRHTLGEDVSKDEVIYKENDSQLFVYTSKSRSEDFLFIEMHGKVTSEVHFLDANQPHGKFQVIEPRRRGIEYSIAHHSDRFYIVTNDEVQNFRLCEAPVKSPGAANWKELRRGNSKLFIEAAETFKSHLILHERENGLPQLRIVDLATMKDHLIEFPEPTYNLGGGNNAEFDTEVFRFSYSSMVTPSTVYDYNLRTRDREVKKTQVIPSGYDREKYASERIYATSPDGTQIPISILYRKDSFAKDGSKPLYLYGYGSYGLSMPASFSTARFSLVDRGFVYAIAHIRGGSEMGRQWYDSAKFLTKKNTFIDFIAAADHLVKEQYSSKGEITIAGGSAGGMLMGAVINARPELFKASIAQVPFVDVLNTMLDTSLPLTTIEFEEWGNPEDPEYYNYIKSYSPYDNVKAQDYPHMLVTSGLNDPRVTYWEPAKWVAKLREMKTDQRLLLQHINMEAGHGGASGRYESLKETAMEYAFVLMVYGKTER